MCSLVATFNGVPEMLAAGGSSPYLMISTLLVIMFVFMFMSSRSRKKDQQSRERMINELARNDRVVTIGGLTGVVTDVKDDEITVKVDESTNAKVRMKKWAVRQVVTKSDESGGDGKQK